MGHWKVRFEDIFAELEGKESPIEQRYQVLRDIFSSSLWEEIHSLSIQFQNGTLSQVEFDKEFQKLVILHERFEEAIAKVNFYEDI